MFVSILGISGIAQILVYIHLSHQRDAGLNVPMVMEAVSPVITNASIAESPPVMQAEVPALPVPSPAHYQDQWSPAMVILVVTSVVSSLGGLVTLIITTLTKSKVEIMRESGNRRDEKVEKIHMELNENTKATEKVVQAVDQTKQRVEEVEKKLPIKQSESGEDEE